MDDYLAISALQHYAFCPRQFAFIHLEQAWEENHYTAEGRLLHERVDTPMSEKRGNIRYERSVLIRSQTHRIQGKMDLLEVHSKDNKQVYFPVEYKRGKPKKDDWDRLQLCAQALCIEEMRNTAVTEGAIWYWEVRRREPVNINAALREQTQRAIASALNILATGKTPAPIQDKKKCRSCSLKEICQPQAFSKDWSNKYVEELGE